MNTVWFVLIVCFLLLMGSLFLLLMSTLPDDCEKIWSFGINSLIALGILSAIAVFLQWDFWAVCAIQKPYASYVVRLVPWFIWGNVSRKISKARKAKEKADQEDTLLRIAWAYVFLFLAFLIPVANLTLGVLFHLRQK
jgi:hypothetical protein